MAGEPLDAVVSGRTITNRDAYRAHRAATPGVCTFCIALEGDDRFVVARHDTMLVRANRFPYAVWENAPVLVHLMVVPLAHRLGLADFTPAEQDHWMCLVADYEARGYSFYQRAPTSTGRSMEHAHAHLILTRR